MTHLTPQQALQEEEYEFPYHFIPRIKQGRFRLTRTLWWGIEYMHLLRLVMEQVREEDFASLLDFGCGDGRLLHEMSRAVPGRRYCGCDFSGRAVAFARALTPEAEFFAGDIRDGIVPGTFDAITMTEVLEHIPPDDARSVLQKVRELLAPGGRLILTVPTARVAVSPKHYRHFTAATLAEALQPLFTVEQVRYVGRLDDPLWSMVQSCRWTKALLLIPPLADFFYRHYGRRCAEAREDNSAGLMAVCRAV